MYEQGLIGESKDIFLYNLSNPELTSVDDPHTVGHSLGHVGLQPHPQLLMNFLSLRYHTGDVFENLAGHNAEILSGF